MSDSLMVPFAKNDDRETEYAQLTGTDMPHMLVAGGTQTGKTTLTRYVSAVAAAKGAIVLVLDPKWRWKKAFKGLPNILVYDDPEEWHGVMMAVRLEMERRYLADQASDSDLLSDHSLFPTMVVVADEFASLLIEADEWWKGQEDPDIPGKKNKGGSPVRSLWTTLLLRGAEARMIAVAATQQANRNVFPNGTQDRGQYGQRVGLGNDLEPTSWSMLAGQGVSKPFVPSGRRGAGAYIRRGGVVPIQSVKVDLSELRRLAQRGIPLLRRAGHLDESGRLTLHGLSGVNLPRPVEIGGTVPVEATVPPRVVGVSRSGSESPAGGPGGSGEMDSVRVVGLAAAVAYLNDAGLGPYTVDSFRKARQRNPIPGEEKVSDRPCWTRLVLRSWHRGRPVAGDRKKAS